MYVIAQHLIPISNQDELQMAVELSERSSQHGRLLRLLLSRSQQPAPPVSLRDLFTQPSVDLVCIIYSLCAMLMILATLGLHVLFSYAQYI